MSFPTMCEQWAMQDQARRINYQNEVGPVLDCALCAIGTPELAWSDSEGVWLCPDCFADYERDAVQVDREGQG